MSSYYHIVVLLTFILSLWHSFTELLGYNVIP